MAICTARYNFNPRSREGSDIKRDYENYDVVNFNPRSREGSDGGRIWGWQDCI